MSKNMNNEELTAIRFKIITAVLAEDRQLQRQIKAWLYWYGYK